MGRVTVRRVEPDDAAFDDVVELDRAAELGRAADDTRWWAAFADEQVVGYAGSRILWPATENPEYFLSRCAVVETYRGLGIQKTLIRARLADARRLGFSEVTTYTVPENAASMRSLIACGFRPRRPRPGRFWAGYEMVHWYRDLTLPPRGVNVREVSDGA